MAEQREARSILLQMHILPNAYDAEHFINPFSGRRGIKSPHIYIALSAYISFIKAKICLHGYPNQKLSVFT